MKLYYCYALKTLWDGQGKTKTNYGVSRVKKQLSGKRSIVWGDAILSQYNKINFTFCNYVNSRGRVQNTGRAKFGVKELILKSVTPTVFIITHTNKRRTS